MSISIPKPLGDPRKAQVADDALQRTIRLRLLEREREEGEVTWRDKQQQLYANQIVISQPKTMAMLISSEQNGSIRDPANNRAKALQNLMTVADPDTAKYILERLEDPAVFYVNQNWNAILRETRKNMTNAGLDKDSFVALVKAMTAENPLRAEILANLTKTDAGIYPSAPLSEAGQHASDQRQAVEEERARKATEETEQEDARQAEIQAQILAHQNVGFQHRHDAEEAIQHRREGAKAIFRANIKKNAFKVGIDQRVAATHMRQAQLALDEELEIQHQARIAHARALQQQAIDDALLAAQPAQAPILGGDGSASAKAAAVLSIGVKPTAVINDVLSHIVVRGSEDSKVYKAARAAAKNMSAPDLKTAIFNIDPKYLRANGKVLNKTELIETYGRHQLSAHQEQTPAVKRSALSPSSPVPTNPFALDPHNLFSSPKLQRSEKAGAPAAAATSPSGNGLHRKVRYGCGISPLENVVVSKHRASTNRHYINGKYIDLNKLKDNILCAKYANNDAHLPTVKVQKITDDVKDIIVDIMADKYSKKLFDKLSSDDKRIIKRLVLALKLDINIDDDADIQFNKTYQILKGEFISGNDSPLVISQLKKYVVEGMNENKIPRRECFQILYQLSL